MRLRKSRQRPGSPPRRWARPGPRRPLPSRPVSDRGSAEPKMPTPAALRAPDADFHQAIPRGLAAEVCRLAHDVAVGDGELVRRTLQGEQDAFAALVARYQKRAFWIAFHVLARVEDARDTAQESFVRLYRSLDKFDHARSFYTWFHRIVLNLAIDHLRKQKSAKATSFDDLHGLADDAPGPEPAERAEQNGQVWRVLAKLDAKFRTVLVLRDI